MTVHHLDPEPGTTIDYFSRASAPVLTVDPGDTVVVRSLDASGYLERLQTPGEVRPTMFTEPRGHCLTGPIAVRGAEPGMVLALRLEFLQPQSWGWTVANARDNALNRRLGLTDLPPSWLLWEIDAEAGTATDQSAHQVRTAPFLGVMGVAPAEFGEHSTIPPRAIGGGNIDCRSLVAGSTLPADQRARSTAVAGGRPRQAGRRRSMRNRHRMRDDHHRRAGTDDRSGDPGHPRRNSLRPDHFGFDADLNEAMAQALDAMIGWMQVLYGVDKVTALALASPCVDLRVTQVANEVWGVHALLPTGAIS